MKLLKISRLFAIGIMSFLSLSSCAFVKVNKDLVSEQTSTNTKDTYHRHEGNLQAGTYYIDAYGDGTKVINYYSESSNYFQAVNINDFDPLLFTAEPITEDTFYFSTFFNGAKRYLTFGNKEVHLTLAKHDQSVWEAFTYIEQTTFICQGNAAMTFGFSPQTRRFGQVNSSSDGFKLMKKDEVKKTITFDTDSSTSTIEPKTEDKGNYIWSLPTPTKDGFAFAGWYKKTNGIVSENILELPYVLNEDIELVAKYVPINPVTARFHTNTSEVSDYELVTNVGSPLLNKNQVTKDGYVFDNWYLNSDFSGEPFNYSTPLTSSIDLYAKWINKDPVNYKDYIFNRYCRFEGEYIGRYDDQKIFILQNNDCATIKFSSKEKLDSLNLKIGNKIAVTGYGNHDNLSGSILYNLFEDTFELLSNDTEISVTPITNDPNRLISGEMNKYMIFKNIQITGKEVQYKETYYITNTAVRIHGAYISKEQESILKLGGYYTVCGYVFEDRTMTLTTLTKYSNNVKFIIEGEIYKEINLEVNKPLLEPETPTRASPNGNFEYIFTEWTTDEEGLNPYAFGNLLLNDLTLYGRFDQKFIPIDQQLKNTQLDFKEGYDYKLPDVIEYVGMQDNTGFPNGVAGNSGRDNKFSWSNYSDHGGSNKGACLKTRSDKIVIHFRNIVESNISINFPLFSPTYNIDNRFCFLAYNKENELVSDSWNLKNSGGAFQTLYYSYKIANPNKDITKLVIQKYTDHEDELIFPSMEIIYNGIKDFEVVRDSLYVAFDYYDHNNKDVNKLGLLVTKNMRAFLSVSQGQFPPEGLNNTYFLEFDKKGSKYGSKDRYVTKISWKDPKELNETYLIAAYVILNDNRVIYSGTGHSGKLSDLVNKPILY